MVVVANEFDGAVKQATTAVDVFLPNVMSEPS
jgi:hypothetical protein